MPPTTKPFLPSLSIIWEWPICCNNLYIKSESGTSDLSSGRPLVHEIYKISKTSESQKFQFSIRECLSILYRGKDMTLFGTYTVSLLWELRGTLWRTSVVLDSGSEAICVIWAWRREALAYVFARASRAFLRAFAAFLRAILIDFRFFARMAMHARDGLGYSWNFPTVETHEI